MFAYVSTQTETLKDPKNQHSGDPVGVSVLTLRNSVLSLTALAIWKQQRAKLSQSVRHLFHQ